MQVAYAGRKRDGTETFLLASEFDVDGSDDGHADDRPEFRAGVLGEGGLVPVAGEDV